MKIIFNKINLNSSNEKSRLWLNIKESILSSAHNHNHDIDPTFKRVDDKDFIILLPQKNDNDSPQPVVFEVKSYANIFEMFEQLFIQIPKNVCSPELLVNSLEAIMSRIESSSYHFPTIPVAKEIISIENENLQNTIANKLMFVYTDIMKPRMLGNTQSRFMRITAINTETKMQTQRITFDHIEYMPIARMRINNISILLADRLGLDIELEPNVITYVMLHFIKKG